MKLQITTALLIAALALAAGCPKQSADGGTDEPEVKSTAAEPLSADALAEANLLNIPPLEGATPFSLSIDRMGKRIYTQLKFKGSNALDTACFQLTDEGLMLETAMAGLPEVTRPYMSAAPFELESLTIGNYQTDESRVNDRVYITGKQSARVVEYENTQGIPEDRPFDDQYGLKPFYSWDGKAVIIPLKFSGVVIYDMAKPGYEFVPYPDFADVSTGMAFHALPDQHGKRLIFASIWQANLYEDDCRLYTLDLDSPGWTEVAQLKWIVYEAGGPDLENEPWIIAGSRGKQAASETTRTPIYGLLDPASGVTEVLRTFGEPVWQIEVEPMGKYILYLDRQRQALVRLNPATGELDYDPRWFNEDAKILTGVRCDTVLLWLRDVLLEADWSGHEQQEGFAE